ncbi:MAG: hypothetical protein V9H69_02500 [Anaerolineae bacterium]
MPEVGATAYPHRMVNFDLQLLLFLLIALLALIAGGVVWLDRALSRRRAGRALGQALDDAPFGVLRLNRTGEAQHANAAAQHLLDLSASSGPLPDEEWADHLLADAEAAGSRYRLVALPRGRWLRAWIDAGSELVFLFDATEQQRAGQASSRLLNDLGHELRTPLATILTHAEVQGLANLPDATRAEFAVAAQRRDAAGYSSGQRHAGSGPAGDQRRAGPASRRSAGPGRSCHATKQRPSRGQGDPPDPGG